MGGGGGIDFAGMIEDRFGIDLGGHSSGDKALDAQRRAGNDANALQKYMYEQNREDTKAWREAGSRAVGGMEDKDFQRDFTLADFQQDPGYQFRMQEGSKALEGSAAARGSLHSGATLKALTKYGQDFASNEFNNAYNRFNADRDRRFNRLASLAGAGQTANSQVAQGGMNYANQAGANMVGIGNAEAANHIGRANRMNQWMDRSEDMMMKGAGMMFSDARLKTDIEEVDPKDLRELKAAIKPYLFRYKNDAHGEGEWLGIMAQDIEKTKLGQRVIVTDETGYKRVNAPKLLSMLIASLAEG